MSRKKRIPIGMEFYKQLIEKDYYYVDKTLLVKDLLDKGGQVNLFTRSLHYLIYIYTTNTDFSKRYGLFNCFHVKYT